MALRVGCEGRNGQKVIAPEANPPKEVKAPK